MLAAHLDPGLGYSNGAGELLAAVDVGVGVPHEEVLQAPDVGVREHGARPALTGRWGTGHQGSHGRVERACGERKDTCYNLNHKADKRAERILMVRTQI